MKFKMIHENYNVSDLDRSIKFYNEALDLHEVRRTTTDDFIIVYIRVPESPYHILIDIIIDSKRDIVQTPAINMGPGIRHISIVISEYAFQRTRVRSGNTTIRM